MSSVSIDAGTDFAAASAGPTEISRRLESLPASAFLWRLVILLSLGGCFEIYDLFLTGYIAPGLARSKLLTATTDAFFGFSGIGAFVGDVCRIVRRNLLPRIPRRPVRPPRDLHLGAARL